MRVHVSIPVRRLDESISFYRSLFEAEPSKIRAGYAKFDLADPPMNFSLVETGSEEARGGVLRHFGIERGDVDSVLAAGGRLEEAGLETEREEDVSCCHSVQTKVWVRDPDGNRWEVFVVTAEESQEVTEADCCEPQCCK
ncbi:MAG: ArsI/CadI family heavy metal resistance metalloenzyme [Planctomycetota bacterium]|nr:ArsI/CadI family heavy metal resistance metalloenzyme [Planctomycetota bacterium]